MIRTSRPGFVPYPETFARDGNRSLLHHQEKRGEFETRSLFFGRGELDLFAPEPKAEHAPAGDDRHRNVTDHAEAEMEDVIERGVRPRPELVAAAVAERVDETLRLVLVFSAQNGEQHFPRRSHKGECA